MTARTMRRSQLTVLADVVALGGATALLARPNSLGVTYAVATLVVLWAGGSYRPRIYYRLWPELPRLLGLLSVAALLAAAWPGPERLTLLEHLPVTFCAVVLARLIAYTAFQVLRSRALSPENALIVGVGGRSQMLAGALERDRRAGIRPVGFVGPPGTQEGRILPVVTDLEHIDRVIESLRVKHVLLADPSDREAMVSTSLGLRQTSDVELWLVPASVELGAAGDAFSSATTRPWPIAFQHLRRSRHYRAAQGVKRLGDVIAAAIMLVLTAPLHVATALAVRLTSPGPVYFRQVRVGQHGEFALLKFRTMTVNDDSDTTWSVHDDQRVTSVGRFLRHSCLDELPQFLNVIRGDMSLVGPRPERPFFASHFSATVPNYEDRLRAPMGITGWAQIHGWRGDTCIAERIRFDNYYIEYWSLGLDVVILVRTAWEMLRCIFLTKKPAEVVAEARAENLPAALFRDPISVPVDAGASRPSA